MCGKVFEEIAKVFAPEPPELPDPPKPPAPVPADAVDDEVAAAPVTAEDTALDEELARKRKGRRSLRIDLGSGVGVSSGRSGVNVT